MKLSVYLGRECNQSRVQIQLNRIYLSLYMCINESVYTYVLPKQQFELTTHKKNNTYLQTFSQMTDSFF